MTIKLLHHSPLWLSSHAIRMSHDSHDKSDTKFVTHGSNGFKETLGICGEKDRTLIERVGNKLKHKSVLEQLVYWFDIDGISRACLQELARHRMARMTVKSSRYTLKELKNANDKELGNFLINGISLFSYLTSIEALKSIRDCLLYSPESVDQIKYSLPEAFKTRLQWQIDGRNIQNFLELRTSKDALWEIRLLARAIFEAIPNEHKYLYEEYMKDV